MQQHCTIRFLFKLISNTTLLQTIFFEKGSATMLHCKFSFPKLTSKRSIATTWLQTKKTKNYILHRELAQMFVLATTNKHFLKR
jgi:hypothetical protein